MEVKVEVLGHLQNNRKVTQNNCHIIKNQHGAQLVVLGRTFNFCGTSQ